MASQVQPFIKADSFQGQKIGYLFKTGNRGLGYYLDSKQKEDLLKFQNEQELIKKRKVESEKQYAPDEVEDLLKKLQQHVLDKNKYPKCADAALKIAKTENLIKPQQGHLWFQLLESMFQNRNPDKPLENYMTLIDFVLSHQRNLFSEEDWTQLEAFTLIWQSERCFCNPDSFQFSRPLGRMREMVDRSLEKIIEARLVTEGQSFKSPIPSCTTDAIFRTLKLCFAALENPVYKMSNWHIPIVRSSLKFAWEKSQLSQILFSEEQRNAIVEMHQKAKAFVSETFNSSKSESSNSFVSDESRWKNAEIAMSNAKKF